MRALAFFELGIYSRRKEGGDSAGLDLGKRKRGSASYGQLGGRKRKETELARL